MASPAPDAPGCFLPLSRDAGEALRPLREAFTAAQDACTNAQENLDAADFRQFRAEAITLSQDFYETL